jgi:ATP-dependent DNA helicase RecG
MLSNTIGVAPSTIQKHINRLNEEGFIFRIGGDFGGYWEIINKEEK